MAYGTVAQVRIETGFNDDTNIPDPVITTKLEYATGIINAKVAQQYALPLALSGVVTVPDLITGLANDMAAALLYMDEYGEESQDTDKGWLAKWKQVTDICDRILDGTLKLFDPDTGEEYDKSDQLDPVFSPNDVNSAAGGSAEPWLSMRQKF